MHLATMPLPIFITVWVASDWWWASWNLIINDESQDQTQEIAEHLASKYPSIVRAIYQENKGRGGAVNRGLAEASGRYFKSSG